MWYKIPGFPGYRVNHQREVLSLKGPEPHVLKGDRTVKLRRDGEYVTCRVGDLMALAGIGLPVPLQVWPHHEAARSHCDAGHEFTPANTMRRRGRNGNQIRKCKECHRKAVAKWRAKRRSA